LDVGQITDAIILITMLAAAAASSGSIYEQAAVLIQRGEIKSAIALLEPRLREAPTDLKALTLMGMAASAENRREQANRYFRQALQADPKFAPALKNLAINELAANETAAAKRHFEELLRLTPGDPLAHLALGDISFAAKNFPAAALHYEQSGELYREAPASLLNFGQALISLHKPQKAAVILEGMPERADARDHFRAGTLLANLGQYRAAAREFQRSRGEGVDAYDAGYNLTLAYVKAGDAAAAERTGEDLIAQGYKRAELYNLLARAYESEGKIKNAYDALRTATVIDPADPANYVELTALCLKHNNFDLALEIVDIGLQRAPTSDRLHVQRGVVLAMKEQFAGARSEFEAAIKLAPERGLPYVALGLILMQMDQTADAVKVLRARTAAARDDYLALWFLGEALNRSGALPGTPENDEALKALTRSVELNPQVVQSRVLLAKLLARRGDFDGAAVHLVRALALDPENVTAMYQLAQVYQKKGDSLRAKELFAKVSKAKAEDREQFTRSGFQHIIRADSR
jgi:tetratricopeptide (TPR) repeat protein